MEQRGGSETNASTPSLARASSSLALGLVGHSHNINGNAETIMEAAREAAVAAGPFPMGQLPHYHSRFLRSLPDSDALWMPAHRPLVGGGAAAAYEASRHDYYVQKRLEERSKILKKLHSSNGVSPRRLSEAERIEKSLSSSSSSPDGVVRQVPPPSPQQQYEMLKLHFMNLVKEVRQTSMLMEMYKQQAVQQGCTAASLEPQMQMMMLQQEQKQIQIQFLKQQLMMLQPHLQNQSTATTISTATSSITPISAPAPLLSPQLFGHCQEYATTEDEEDDDDDDDDDDSEDHGETEEVNDHKRPPLSAQDVDPCDNHDKRPAKRQRENENAQRSIPEETHLANHDEDGDNLESGNERTDPQPKNNDFGKIHPNRHHNL